MAIQVKVITYNEVNVSEYICNVTTRRRIVLAIVDNSFKMYDYIMLYKAIAHLQCIKKKIKMRFILKSGVFQNEETFITCVKIISNYTFYH